MEVFKTKKAKKRADRNQKILELYASYIKIEGSMKSAVAEQVSRELKVSVTTVNRVVKPTLTA